MLTILGGGPAGLAAAAEAARRGHDCRLFEAAPRLGGNCVTFRHGPFAYDSGAHRFHDKDPRVTERIKALMGEELVRVSAPSRICTRAGAVGFPLQATTLPWQLGLRRTARAAWDYLHRPTGEADPATFEELAIRAYGRELSDLFLLGYSAKLWGVPCERLSPTVAGSRLRGLGLRALLPGSRASAGHLEGAFYYPRDGYGRICDRLAEAAGTHRLVTRAKVTAIAHNGRRIMRVEINGEHCVRADAVCCTLPVPLVMRLLRPAVDDAMLEIAAGLRFRNVVLVALFLDRPSVSPCASLYFPDPDVPFTRVVEPRNRSASLAPDGQTSLVAEIPCFASDPLWSAPDEELTGVVADALASYGLIARREVIGSDVRRLSNAYPVLELGVEAPLRELLRYLDRFDNLAMTGRNGRFVYRHLHDMVRFGEDAVLRLEATGALSRPTSARLPGRIASEAAVSHQ